VLTEYFPKGEETLRISWSPPVGSSLVVTVQVFENYIFVNIHT
jgi:hypothetical protein